MKKVCGRCGKEKEEGEYRRRGRNDPRLQSYCIVCINTAMRETRAKDRGYYQGLGQLAYLREKGRLEGYSTEDFLYIDKVGKRSFWEVNGKILVVANGSIGKPTAEEERIYQ